MTNLVFFIGLSPANAFFEFKGWAWFLCSRENEFFDPPFHTLYFDLSFTTEGDSDAIFFLKKYRVYQWLILPSISSTFTCAFFVRNFGVKAETYLEKVAKKDVCMKNLYVKRWWNWYLTKGKSYEFHYFGSILPTFSICNNFFGQLSQYPILAWSIFKPT